VDNIFNREKKENIKKIIENTHLASISKDWLIEVSKCKYSYNFTWLGRPIIQFPQDIIAMQEIIWQIKPDMIIETGIAHGGSIIFYASMLELIAQNGLVVGIDIDIREHNRIEIEKNPMFKRIKMIQGSSIDEEIFKKVKKYARHRKKVMVVLDSNHTHDHVLNELRLYSPLVSVGSYVVVFDTIVEDMPTDFFPNRPWGRGNNPRTAVREFLKENDRFKIDNDIGGKLLITVAQDGFLKCIK
jgi:cephalosporin hydroxylase